MPGKWRNPGPTHHAPKNEKRISMNMESHPTIVLMVHGTWARGADWNQATSEFAQRLQRAYRTPLVFESFKWSGRNGHKARVLASNQLRKQIQEMRSASADADIYIVAHSHGETSLFFL